MENKTKSNTCRNIYCLGKCDWIEVSSNRYHALSNRTLWSLRRPLSMVNRTVIWSMWTVYQWTSQIVHHAVTSPGTTSLMTTLSSTINVWSTKYSRAIVTLIASLSYCPCVTQWCLKKQRKVGIVLLCFFQLFLMQHWKQNL